VRWSLGFYNEVGMIDRLMADCPGNCLALIAGQRAQVRYVGHVTRHAVFRLAARTPPTPMPPLINSHVTFCDTANDTENDYELPTRPVL